MFHVLALEAADGAVTTFTSPTPGTLVPTLNGRTLTEGFTILDRRSVRFDEPPRMGDEIGFFVSP